MLAPLSQFKGFNVTFNTGEACNLACTYCYEINKKQTKLSLDYAQKFIDLLLTSDIAALEGTEHEWILQQGLILDFIGGDSLMFPELVDDIISYFVKRAHLLQHRWRDNWRVSISTNGTLFENPKVRELLEKWQPMLSMSLSIDGCPAIHDKNRIFTDGTGTMDAIRRNLDWYKSMFPHNYLTTKSTLNRDSIPYLYESLVFMHKELGIPQINQNFIFENMNLTRQDLKIFDQQMEKCVEYVWDNRDTLYWGMIDNRFYKALSYRKNVAKSGDVGWCGSGSMPAVAVDGKIYPCFRFLPHTQGSGIDMSIGDIWSGVTKPENFVCIRSQTRSKISPLKCKLCKIESSCAWCIAGAYSEKGKPARQTYICKTQKIQAKWANRYWTRFHKEYPEAKI